MLRFKCRVSGAGRTQSGRGRTSVHDPEQILLEIRTSVRTTLALQALSGKGTRHQFAQTKFVERSHRGQVVPPEAIVNHAQSRHDDAWAVAIANLHDRQPEPIALRRCRDWARFRAG